MLLRDGALIPRLPPAVHPRGPRLLGKTACSCCPEEAPAHPRSCHGGLCWWVLSVGLADHTAVTGRPSQDGGWCFEVLTGQECHLGTFHGTPRSEPFLGKKAQRTLWN